MIKSAINNFKPKENLMIWTKLLIKFKNENQKA